MIRLGIQRYTRAEVLTPVGLGRFKESNRLCCGKTNPELGQEVTMSLLRAHPVTVLPDQREMLEQLIRTHSTPQQLALRARMIVHAAEGMGVRKSARERSANLRGWASTMRPSTPCGPQLMTNCCPSSTVFD